MRRNRFALAAVSLLATAGLAAGAQPAILGTVHQGDHDHPIPGALVTLYDAGDLMIDSTYTRDDGGFRLLAPQQKGRFYAVATQGGQSRRKEFGYDPMTGRTQNLAFVLPRKEEGFLAQAGRFLLSTLGAVFGTIVGLVVGLLFRSRVEEPLAARAKRDFFLADLRAFTDQALKQYPQGGQDANPNEITAAVTPIRQFLERRSDIVDTLARLDKKKGRESFRTLGEKLAQAEDLLTKAPGLAENKKRENLLKARAILQEIRDRPLT